MPIVNIDGTDLVENGPSTINDNFAQCVLGSTNLTVTGAVPYVSSTGTLNQDSTQLFWNASTNCMGIGTNAPTYALHVSLAGSTQALFAATGANSAYLTINAEASQETGVILAGAGASKFKVYKDVSDQFAVYDDARARNAILINTSGQTAITAPRFPTGNTTGGGSASLSTNCPAVTPTAPYTWITVVTNDGSTGYIPVWK